MHVCLLIDLLTLFALIYGLRYSAAPSRRMLCLGSLLYLLAVSLHFYFLFAPWFGFFQQHRSMVAIGITALLNFFGGFWTFFGVMVFARGVSWIALAFALYHGFCWLAKPRPSGQHIQSLLNPNEPV
jgi:hypothetical protein